MYPDYDCIQDNKKEVVYYEERLRQSMIDYIRQLVRMYGFFSINIGKRTYAFAHKYNTRTITDEGVWVVYNDGQTYLIEDVVKDDLCMFVEEMHKLGLDEEQ